VLTRTQLGVVCAVIVIGFSLLAWRAWVDFRHGRRVRFALQTLGAALGIGVGVFVYARYYAATAVQKHATVAGHAFSNKETIISAILLGGATLFVVAVMFAALPLVMDRMEGRTFVSFVATRHVRSQKSGFLTVISVLAICGVAISSCALSSVVSVMGGFSQDLKRKILGNNAHIVIDTVSQSPWGDSDQVLAHVRALPGVIGATPVVNGEVMISSPSNLAGVIVRGLRELRVRFLHFSQRIGNNLILWNMLKSRLWIRIKLQFKIICDIHSKARGNLKNLGKFFGISGM
jgi:hypothetical protein